MKITENMTVEKSSSEVTFSSGDVITSQRDGYPALVNVIFL